MFQSLYKHSGKQHKEEYQISADTSKGNIIKFINLFELCNKYAKMYAKK